MRALGNHLVMLADSMDKGVKKPNAKVEDKGGNLKVEQKGDKKKIKRNIEDKEVIMTQEMIKAGLVRVLMKI